MCRPFETDTFVASFNVTFSQGGHMSTIKRIRVTAFTACALLIASAVGGCGELPTDPSDSTTSECVVINGVIYCD